HACNLFGRDRDGDSMRLRQDVIFCRRTPRISALTPRRIAARTPVALIAGLAHGLRRPAEAALLIALARRRGAAIGRRGILTVRLRERPFRPPDVPRR